MKHKEGTAYSQTIGYVKMCCACDKPKLEKRTIVMTMTTSFKPFEPIVTQETKYFCRICGLEIYPQEKANELFKKRK
jgi:hypothetical protein